jgi:hypothetical protein
MVATVHRKEDLQGILGKMGAQHRFVFGISVEGHFPFVLAAFIHRGKPAWI